MENEGKPIDVCEELCVCERRKNESGRKKKVDMRGEKEVDRHGKQVGESRAQRRSGDEQLVNASAARLHACSRER